MRRLDDEHALMRTQQLLALSSDRCCSGVGASPFGLPPKSLGAAVCTVYDVGTANECADIEALAGRPPLAKR